MSTKPMDLQAYRQSIDIIDQQLITLLAKRKHCVEGVAAIKKEQGMAARQPARFETVVTRCRALAAADDFDPDVAEAIWQLLHEYFVRLEEAKLSS